MVGLAADRNKAVVGRFEKTVQKKVGRAIADYHMLKDGDKILVAVSGGKDSLALLELLMERRVFVPIKYDIVAVYVDLGIKSTDEAILREFLRKKGCRFYFVRRKIFQGNKASKPTCFWCSWNRRKVLFESARKHGCNKIALGHHKDDIIATIMMNLLFEGQISAMAPFQELFRGKISIIRPLAYLEEQEVERFVKSRQIPAADLFCPYSKTTKRAFVKKFIDEVEAMCPNVKTNIFKSLQRVKKDYLL